MGSHANLPKPRATYQLQYFSGNGYAIIDPAGRRISGYRYDASLLQVRFDALRAEHDAKAKRGPRPCMCCTKTFDSQGIHNRMCDDCRHRDVAPDPFKVQVSRARRAA